MRGQLLTNNRWGYLTSLRENIHYILQYFEALSFQNLSSAVIIRHVRCSIDWFNSFLLYVFFLEPQFSNRKSKNLNSSFIVQRIKKVMFGLQEQSKFLVNFFFILNSFDNLLN